MRIPAAALRALAGSLAAAAASAALIAAAMPAAAAPSVGQCWIYQVRDPAKLAVPGAPVPCTGQHKAETFALGTLPSDFRRLEKATMREVIAIRTSACTEAAMRDYLGLPPGLPTRFRPVAVFPSNARLAAGERWVRCDAVLDTGIGLGAIHQPAPGWVAANRANPTAFAFCTPSTGYFKMPSPTKTVARACTNPGKQWILVARPTMGQPAQRYPGPRVLDRRAARACSKYKDVYSGGKKDPFARGWSYIFPLAKGWGEGLRTGSCWVPLKQYLDTPRAS